MKRSKAAADGMFERVAVVATGVIGRSWIEVFARAGCEVAVFDADPDQLDRAMAWFRRERKALRAAGSLTRKAARGWRDRVRAAESLEDAVGDAEYIQESGPEQLQVKRALFAELDALAPRTAIIASSTSAIDMTDIAEDIPGASRCIVAHPVNPPHVVPAVEILGGARTRPRVVRQTIAFQRAIGQVPVLLKRFAPGFILNRMQAALIREAVHLVQSGVADVEAVDDSIRAGLGLRWAIMGPFGVANTNADGGVREYFGRYGGAYHQLWDDLETDVRFDEDLIDRLGRETDKALGTDRAAQRAWRDRMVTTIRAEKRADPPPTTARQRRART